MHGKSVTKDEGGYGRGKADPLSRQPGEDISFFT
jgi:hypothetical protein